MIYVMMFICSGCQLDRHEACKERNKDKHTSDCDCQHRSARSDES